jgi:hypothetical protein
MALLLRLPSDDAWVSAGDASYLIPADWVGEHEIVSECGWWMGKICIVEIDGMRYIEWLQAYSLNLD